MTTKRRTALKFIILLICLFAIPCFADEIQFQNQKGLQTGVVVGEDDESVTIRFPKEAIKSITRTGKQISTPISEKVVWEEGDDYLILKIPRHSIQFVPQEPRAGTPPMKQAPTPSSLSRERQEAVQAEGRPEKIQKAGTGLISGSSTNMSAQQELLQEEMGGVQGLIMWRGKPLEHAKVKIVLERYTGFSLAALKRLFAADKEQSPRNEIVLEAHTDAQGRYVFPKVPPGYYRLYWLPDTNTGWVRRLREKPDFEVIAGNVTIADIPEKKE